MSLGDFVSEREQYKLMSVDYHEEAGDERDHAIIDIIARDSNGGKVIKEIEGFHPYFYITSDEFVEDVKDTVNEKLIRRIEIPESVDERIDAEYLQSDKVQRLPESRTTLHQQDAVRLYVNVPANVGELREEYETHFEADVFFEDRFLIDKDIRLGFSAPADKQRVHVDEIEPLSEDETPDVRPRIISFDLEVAAPNGFPEPTESQEKVTAISAHDSYSDEYKQWVLRHESWQEVPDWEMPDGAEAAVSVFAEDEEQEMLEDFQIWAAKRQPDMFTGWNASGFDFPYLINRSFNINAWSVYDLCPLQGEAQDVFVTRSGSAVMSGVELFDMMDAYKKSQVHELDNYSLEHVSQKELDYGKVDMPDIDDAWENDPVRFVKYSIRDTQAVVEIESSTETIEMYDDIRSIAGTQYNETNHNFSIIDTMFLRKAKEMGYVLPTSEKPDRGWYYGAYVENPTPGKNEAVGYFDLASLYPNLMIDLNISPETFVGTKEDLEASEYTKEDCHTAYIDMREDKIKKESDPEYTEVYYLKSSVKEGFISGAAEELIDMKMEYKGSDKYEAVKRITNSCYGVVGDSDSFGKGFRLFDWRLGETITLAGRKVLQETGNLGIEYLKENGHKEADIVGGDTDSQMISINDTKGLDSLKNGDHIYFDAVDYVNNGYKSYMKNEFGVTDTNMEVELESYADVCFFLRDFDEPEGTGVKKKYSQLITWDEGEIIEDPEPKTKGFQLIRSDSAKITRVAQKRVLHMILKEDEPKRAVMDYLNEKWSSAVDGDVSLEDIATPSALTRPLWTYGWTQDENTGEVKYSTPHPHIRGARYANAFLDGEEIRGGDKPLMFYCDGVEPSSGLPETYCYDNKLDAPDGRNIMKEEGRYFDALAVKRVSDIPEGVRIDYEKMADKTLKNPIEPITSTMGWSWTDVTTETEQVGLNAF